MRLWFLPEGSHESKDLRVFEDADDGGANIRTGT